MLQDESEPAVVLVGERYALLDRLGVGGMGEVWRAHDRLTAEAVAVKILRPSLATDPASVMRFQREVEAMTRLDHPRIVPVIDAGADRRIGLYFVMALQHGRPLHEVAHSWGHWRQIAPVIDQILDTLAYAHGQGIIHRDIKPDNILIDDEGEAVLLDFGVARLRDRARSGTSAYDMIGTVDYAAPEQASGKRRRIGPWTDLYAFAIVIYELVCGRLPFMASTPVQSLMIRMDNSCPPLDPLPGFATPVGLLDVLDRMMRPNVFERLRHARAARAAFAALRDGPFEVLVPASPEGRERPKVATSTTDGEFGRLFQKRRARYLESPLGPSDLMDPPVPEAALRGRDEALATLSGAMERWIAAPRPGALVVWGEAGVGKSRFVRELVTAPYVAGAVDVTRLTWGHRVTPRSFARKLVGAVGLEAEPAAKQTQWWLRGHGVAEDARIEQVQAWLVDEDEGCAHAALITVLTAAGRGERPLVLILDDLERVDAGTLQVVEASHRCGVPLLYLITARALPDAPPPWLLRTARRLEPLGLADARQVVADLVALDPAATEALAESTSGNPGRLRAALLAQARQGMLVPAWPQWQPAPAGWRDGAPPAPAEAPDQTGETADPGDHDL